MFYSARPNEMTKFILAVFALVLMTSTISSASVLVLKTSPKLLSPFGIVEGIKDCGSEGKLGTVQVTDCTQVPCHLIPNSVYDIAIRFTASATSQDLHLIVYKIEPEWQDPILDVPINGIIEAGIEYEMTFKLPVTADFANTGFDIRFYIVDIQNSRFEVCAEAAVTIGPA